MAPHASHPQQAPQWPEDKPGTRWGKTVPQTPLPRGRIPKSNTCSGKTGKMAASRDTEGNFGLGVALGRRKTTTFLPRKCFQTRPPSGTRIITFSEYGNSKSQLKPRWCSPFPSSLSLPLCLPSSLSPPPSLCSYVLTNLEVQPGSAFLQE